MLRAVAAFFVLVLASSAALAEKRIALLIGNQSYGTEIGRLANPHNDVALLETALKGLGFEVVTVRDAGLAVLTRSINSYARRVQGAGPNAVGFFYYSGHGAADAGTNYLIPVDVSTTETGELWDQSLRLTEVTRKLKAEAGKASHFVVFDACRNTLKLTKAGSRAVVQSKGFVPVVQESGMLIAYATAEGELASDVGAGAGPYAMVLAEEIVKPGIEAVGMFRRVQVRVRSTIGQEPWLGFSAIGEVHLAGLTADLAKPPTGSAPSAVPGRLSDAAEAWGAVKDGQRVADLEAFVSRYKDTFYAELARSRIDELKKQQVGGGQPKAQEADIDRFLLWSQTKSGSQTEPNVASALAEKPETSKERYEQAYGFLLKRDYGGAEAAFDEFLKRHGDDPLAGNAQYWLGESFYVRGQYRAAAGAFLKGYQTYARSAKAPESLLKLAMSLQRLGQKDAACSSYNEITVKFPNAPKHVKETAQSERQRAGC